MQTLCVAQVAEQRKAVDVVRIVAVGILVRDVAGITDCAVDVGQGTVDLRQASGVGVERRGVTGHRDVGTTHCHRLGSEPDLVQAIRGTDHRRQSQQADACK